MRLTPSTKGLLTLVLLLAGAVYIVIVELAISAGQVHHGVNVNGFDIAGLNRQEAADALQERGDLMKATPLIFTSEGFECRFTPEEVGWGPQPADTAEAAMQVGRGGSLSDALAERWRAWTSGVTIDWQGSQDPARVGRELNRCERIAERVGVEIDRPRLRYLIKLNLVRWPRAPVEIPLAN